MFRWSKIFLLMLLATPGIAQETRIVDSLQEAYASQEGREKVKTMIELTWDFYDVSFDDCISWGEKAVKEANTLGYGDLEAKANYVLGIQYAHHADLDLAKDYLRRSYAQNMALADTANAFEALWSIATYELTLGNVDSSAIAYDKALNLAEQLKDSLSIVHIFLNQAAIHHQKSEYQQSLNIYIKAKRVATDLGATSLAMQAHSNIATVYMESGKPVEAKEMFLSLLPQLEANEDYWFMQNVYMNLGSLYVNDFVNYDSAMHYFEKSIHCADFQVQRPFEQNRMRVLKSDVLSEMANISFLRGDSHAALKGYAEALALAEAENHLTGQMIACAGFGKIYAQLGQASKSMAYLNRYYELEAKTGVTKMHIAVRLPLVLNYARLGRFDELEKELRDIDEERAAFLRENVDLHDRNHELEETVENLVRRMEEQDAQNEALQTRLRRCRMAIFGCLALALATLLGWIAAKIVKHYFASRAKSTK